MSESLDKSKPIVLAVTGASGAVYGFSLLKFFLDSAYKVDLVLSSNALKVAKQELDLELEGLELPAIKQKILNYLFGTQSSTLTAQSTISSQVQTSLSSKIEQKKLELKRKQELKMKYRKGVSYDLNESNSGLQVSQNSNTQHLSSHTYHLNIWSPENVAASISSGSYKTLGMIIAPCSMGTIANIAAGTSNNLIARAADVTLKERRKLVLLARETPLSTIHLRNMLSLSELGTIVVPAAPGFYHKPQSIQDQINFVLGKALDVFGIENEMFLRWNPQATPALV